MALSAGLMLSGCGSSSQSVEELSSYRTEMEEFFTELESAQNAINGIDASDESAEEALYNAIDGMSTACTRISETEPPAGYESIQEAAAHAAMMMGQAASGFREAFDGESFDQNAYDAAMEYYKAAGNDIQLMIEALQTSFDQQ